MTDLLYKAPVTAHASGYTEGAQLAEAWKAGRFARLFRLGPRIVSAELSKAEGRGVWKHADRLPTERPGELLDGLERAGVMHPSSYADAYYQLAPSVPPLKHTINGIFSWWPGGAWSEARITGDRTGVWYRYDLVSAYRWAATLGLPLTDAMRVTTRRRNLPGLWVCEIKDRRDAERLPPVFRPRGPVVLSSEELDAYRVNVTVIRGVEWDHETSKDHVERILRRLPCAKESGRAYWGRWIAKDPLVCWTPAKEWTMRNIYANFVWGWLIVGRVRLRLWDVSQDAAHVYVDEVVTRQQLPTGSKPGDWHLKQEYPNGVRVVRTGAFGPRRGDLDMETGVKRYARSAAWTGS